MDTSRHLLALRIGTWSNFCNLSDNNNKVEFQLIFDRTTSAGLFLILVVFHFADDIGRRENDDDMCQQQTAPTTPTRNDLVFSQQLTSTSQSYLHQRPNNNLSSSSSFGQRTSTSHNYQQRGSHLGNGNLGTDAAISVDLPVSSNKLAQFYQPLYGGNCNTSDVMGWPAFDTTPSVGSQPNLSYTSMAPPNITIDNRPTSIADYTGTAFRCSIDFLVLGTILFRNTYS